MLCGGKSKEVSALELLSQEREELRDVKLGYSAEHLRLDAELIGSQEKSRGNCVTEQSGKALELRSTLWIRRGRECRCFALRGNGLYTGRKGKDGNSKSLRRNCIVGIVARGISKETMCEGMERKCKSTCCAVKEKK